MACDQDEYCGGCECYNRCMALAKIGKLEGCAMDKKGERSMKDYVIEAIAGAVVALSLVAITFICTIGSGYHWE